MPIVFDQVDAVVEPTASDPEPPPEGAGEQKEADIGPIQTHLERAQRRQRRLLAD